MAVVDATSTEAVFADSCLRRLSADMGDGDGLEDTRVCIVHHHEMQLHVPPHYREIYELPRRIIAIENRLKGLATRDGFPREQNFGGRMQLLPSSRSDKGKQALAFGSPASKKRLRRSHSTGAPRENSAWDFCDAVEAPNVEMSDLLLVHSEEHITTVTTACKLAIDESAAFLPLSPCSHRRKPKLDDADGDTYYSPDSMAAFKRAAGGAVESVRQLFRIDSETGRATGSSDVRASFAIVRPPGHHCCDAPSGFCYFNNSAIAASHARAVLGLKRVAIVDWDYHHGDGTQKIFYRDPSVLTVSLHVALTEDGLTFPKNRGMSLACNGLGLGRGYCINVPWPHDRVGVAEYDEAFRGVVVPALRGFDPELIVVASGFDAVKGDTLAGTRLPPSGYYRLTQQLLALGRPLALVLEGGYSPTLIAEASLHVVHALLGRPPPGTEDQAAPDAIAATLGAAAFGGSKVDLATGHVLNAVRRRLNTLPPWSAMRNSGGGPYFHEDPSKEAAAASDEAAAKLAEAIEREAEID